MAFQSGKWTLLFPGQEDQNLKWISSQVRETITEKCNGRSVLFSCTEATLRDRECLASLLGYALFYPEFEFDKKERIKYAPSAVLQFCMLESLLAIEEPLTHPSEHERLLISVFSSALSNFNEYTGLPEHECNERMRSSCSTILPQAQQKLCFLLGPALTLHFMRFWAFLSAHHEYPYPLYNKKIYSNMRISNKSSTGEFLMITSYASLLSMEIMSSTSSITEGDDLHRHLNSQLLHCVFQFRNVVTFFPDWIEVKLEIDNVRCDVSQYESAASIYELPKSKYRDERHFPAKICLQIGPQNGRIVESISLSESWQNPITNIGKATFEPPVKMRNWGFEQSAMENGRAKIDWTLYDRSTRKAVFNGRPPNFSLLSPKLRPTHRHFNACRAFTEGGGVVFAKDEYGAPMTWRLQRDLEGQTLKWIVEGSIWLTYWPSTYRTRCSETKRYEFRQEFV